MMGPVRFSKIVETVGKPSVHLLWMEPAKDRVLQKAINANCVMTIHQYLTDTRSDFGVVGFQKGIPGQILIFPRSLKCFAGRRVVGVKYDLLEWPAVPRNQQSVRTGSAKRPAKQKSHGTEIPSVTGKRPAGEERVTARVIKFPTPEADNEDEPHPDVVEIKDQVRHALKVLGEGKRLAALNLLKRIVDS
jgi:hypothetical protein